MEDSPLKPQSALIIGAGAGGIKFFEMLQGTALFDVVGVVDIFPDAPGIKLAQSFNIPTFADVEEALKACAPCTAFNCTNDETLSVLAAKIIGPGNIIGGHEALLIWTIVSQAEVARDKLKRNTLLTESIVNHAMEGIIVIDSNGVVQSFNPAAEAMFGYGQIDVIENNISMLMPSPVNAAHDGYLAQYLDTGKAHVVGIEREVIARHKSGKTFPISLSVSQMTSGSEHLFIGIVADISKRKDNEEKVKKLAHFDPLTGLANRTLFYDRIHKALALSKRQGHKLAILFLDLDGFKQVNDSFGHIVGDMLLKKVADRLLLSTRDCDTLARFGGDEFAFVLSNIKSKENIAALTDKMISRISEPYFLNGNRCDIGGSIGIAVFPDDHMDMTTLINQADAAMYAVKKSGKNGFKFYDPSMTT
ncbi:MAG: diguanylate cyclase [Mariprofundus sp.]